MQTSQGQPSTGVGAGDGAPGAGGAATMSGGADGAERLSAELEAALLRELVRAWHGVNSTHFRSVLLPPTLALEDAASRLGQWQGGTRTLSISRRLILGQPWPVVVEVLKHEMAHQYVHEVLGLTDEAAHGPTFRALCERLGIDASAAGLPAVPPSVGEGTVATGESDAASEAARQLRRIARLLALAESQNLHEAEMAMREAQRLMLKHNLSERSARANRGAGAVPQRYGYRQLGAVKRRVDEGERLLAMLLSQHFFVESIWVPSFDVRRGVRGSALEICGTPENLEMAAYVYDFLLHTAERLWKAHRRERALPGDRERRTFIAGVMIGFGERLTADAQVQAQEGLIWVGDADLGQYLRKRHPHVRRVMQRGQPRTATRAEGKKAGREIVLHKPLTGGGRGQPTTPRALPPKR